MIKVQRENYGTVRARMPFGTIGRAVVACAIILLGAGCGGPGAFSGAPLVQSSPAAGATPSAEVLSASPGSSSHASPRPSKSASPGQTTGNRTAPTPLPSYAQYAPGTAPAQITVTLSASCVTQGHPQTISITGAAAMYVAFDAQYADGKEGGSYGGVGKGTIPPTGTYTSTWVVGVKAPSGPVTVFVAAQDGKGKTSAFRQPTFNVSSSC